MSEHKDWAAHAAEACWEILGHNNVARPGSPLREEIIAEWAQEIREQALAALGASRIEKAKKAEKKCHACIGYGKIEDWTCHVCNGTGKIYH